MKLILILYLFWPHFVTSQFNFYNSTSVSGNHFYGNGQGSDARAPTRKATTQRPRDIYDDDYANNNDDEEDQGSHANVHFSGGTYTGNRLTFTYIRNQKNVR